MAGTTASAPSMGLTRLQTSISGGAHGVLDHMETWLDVERDQLPLWLPVLTGGGIAAWYALMDPAAWMAFMAGMAALALTGLAIGLKRRLAVVLLVAGLAACMGCGLAWWRAESVATSVLVRPVMAQFAARVERIEMRGSDKGIRLMLRPIEAPQLPSRVRVSVKVGDLPADLRTGEQINLKARLMPPATAMVPGAYDFARVAWFQGIGGTGKAIGKIERVGATTAREASIRNRLSAHIGGQLEGSIGGVATAFVTGDRGAISAVDEEVMRDSGLAHLLSISGLHITAVVAGAMALALRLLALSQRLALRLPLLTISAGVGALAGIGYTLLAGAEVPTIRSCIAAILVLIGLAMGREAITLRLVATGALIVLIMWPESLVGPSFQLSFAAITSIVALHENARFQSLVQRRDEGHGRRLGRAFLSLLITGLVVECTLAPIALFHFHKAGLYGALANIVAIPLTTFVIMPLEALALALDLVGLGAPAWWLVGQALAFMLALARAVAGAPGAVATLPAVPVFAFSLMIAGGLWILLWRTRIRWIGGIPLTIGAVFAIITSPPDMLITNDGRHMAMRGADGRYAILRPRAGDYVRDMLAERAGFEGDLDDLESMAGARCNADVCTVKIDGDGRIWRVLATRSRDILPWRSFVALCAEADVVVSDRALPKGCTPRWFKADRLLLAQTGGLAIDFGTGSVDAVKIKGDQHPWVLAAQNRSKKMPRRLTQANQ
jgi:competence protein ComEC